MSQTTDTTLSDQSGASFRTELNSIISALNTDFTGATAPTTPEAYMRWMDTSVSPNVLRRRNAANSAWELHPTQQLATDAMPKSGGTFTGAYNGKQGADIASAATTDIGAATGNSVNVTGVVTITSLGTPAQAGIKRTVTFTGILILTHNATTLILPSAANVRTQVGDVAEFISTATGWRCTMYRRASGVGGVVDGAKGADIASAATTDIGAATGDYVVVTGTTTITALGTAPAGEYREVRFAGALTLTHNATTLILPNNANVLTVAGDVARFRSEGSGNWRCTNYTRADGSAITAVFTKSFTSAQQTITVAGLLTLAHGLAVSPKIIQLELYCNTAEQNFAIGDTLAYYPDNTSSRGCQVYYDATNVYARFGSTGTMAVQNKTTGASAFITAANWRLVVRAYA